MEANDYRLERWLAILLSLLFFLPFVAKGDEILYTGSFHGEEIEHASGAEFLALTHPGVLVPVRILVVPEEDMGDAGDEKSGKNVSVPGFDDVLLVRGTSLHPGTVASARPDFIELIPSAWKATIAFNGREHELSYRCNYEECTLVLASGEVTQDLVSIEIEKIGSEINTLDVVHVITFAGDLDHDGKLDLIADLPRHWNEGRPTLWLSGAAKDGQLLGMTAELSTTGC